VWRLATSRRRFPERESRFLNNDSVSLGRRATRPTLCYSIITVRLARYLRCHQWMNPQLAIYYTRCLKKPHTQYYASYRAVFKRGGGLNGFNPRNVGIFLRWQMMWMNYTVIINNSYDRGRLVERKNVIGGKYSVNALTQFMLAALQFYCDLIVGWKR